MTMTKTKQMFASVAAVSLGVLPAFASSHAVSPEPVQPTHDSVGTWGFQHEGVLGTSLDVAIHAPTRAVAVKAEAAALAEFDRQSRILSAWDETSEFSRWMKTRDVAVKVSPELMDGLASFDAWRKETGGVLDPASAVAAEMWSRGAITGVAPSKALLRCAVEAMRQPHWTLDRVAGTATHLDDAPLVLASFVKSSITSHAADAALRVGATGVMLNVGGDIVTRGAMTQRVEIANPQADAENAAVIDTVVLKDQAIATSGSYRRGFDVAGEHMSHLIDPRTGAPASGVLSSSVVAKDAETAGALATALSILSPRESKALMERHPEAEYLLVLKSGERVESKGWTGLQEPGLRPAGYVVKAGSGAPAVPATAWNQSMELTVKLELPRMDNPRYRRPYVAVWIEDADKYPVRTVALWFKLARYLNDMRAWYADDRVRNLAEGTDISTTVSSATRAPGTYTVVWDGKDNTGKLVKAGKYTVVVEAAREHGGHSLLRQEIDFNGKPQQFALPASDELGAVALDYRKK